MPERHLLEFERYYEKQPFGLWRDDYRIAQLAVVIARSSGNKLFGVNDVMQFWSAGGAGAGDVDALVMDADVVM
ncbi:phage tail assembly protein T [Achromobacter marplatensis]